MIVTFPGMCAFGVWHSLALSLRSSPICSMR